MERKKTNKKYCINSRKQEKNNNNLYNKEEKIKNKN